MTRLKKMLHLVAAAGLAFGAASIVGCEQEGPLERGAENVEDAGRDAGDAIEDAGDELGE